MPKAAAVQRKQSLAYNLFILTLTILSLLIMVGLLLPLSPATKSLLQLYDNLFCVIYLLDFVVTLRAVPSKAEYFFQQRGWLDLLGSIPYFGIFSPYSALLRLARISRMARLLRGMKNKDIVRDALENRGQYALMITFLTALIVLTVASMLELQFESLAPDARIRTGGEAIWFSIVTIATVGYGDYYPVTTGGRVVAVFIMLCGVGIIGALASIFSSILLGKTTLFHSSEDEPEPDHQQDLEQELSAIRSELAEMRRLLDQQSADKEHSKTA